MVRSDPSDLFRALVHVGTVEAVRQRYTVFITAGADYVVFSPSRRGSLSYHMAVVSSEKVDALYKAVGKEGATTGLLMKDRALGRIFGEGDRVAVRFDILMALYVLAAAGKLTMEKEGRKLVFRRTAEP
ncbi:MAG: hypothetical protein JRM80_12805 [Nitrososphaerota archaeon]|nr:hypothetical protein [Nitrososphaerota archaeon]